MPRRKPIQDPDQNEKLREHMEHLHARMMTLKVAYMNRTAFEGKVPTTEDLRAAAESFIQANYAYQRALYGRVRIKLSPANLLR